MDKEAMAKIIESHNKVVSWLESCNIRISDTQVMTAISIWHALACEGHDIVVAARAAGLDVVVNMQSGRILYNVN